MITEEWRKFKGWYVLEFFLKTNKEVYIKGLAKELKISPQTASYYMKFYKKVGILKERKEANILLYSLSDNVLTRQLKIFYILDIIYPFIIKFAKENNVVSVILYGSHASGTYDKNSDIDLIVISQQKELKLDELKKLERKIRKEVKIQVFSIGEWRNFKRTKNAFVQSVLSKSILLYGSEI